MKIDVWENDKLRLNRLREFLNKRKQYRKRSPFHLAIKRKMTFLNTFLLLGCFGLLAGIGGLIWLTVESLENDSESFSKKTVKNEYVKLENDNTLVTSRNISKAFKDSINGDDVITNTTLKNRIDVINNRISIGRLSDNQLTQKYVLQSEFESIIVNGRLSTKSLDENYAKKNKLDMIKDAIANDWLKESELQSKYVEKTSFNPLNSIVTTGRLSNIELEKSFVTLKELNTWSPNDFTIDGDTLVKGNLGVNNKLTLKDTLLTLGTSHLLQNVTIGYEGDSQATPAIPPSPANLNVRGLTEFWNKVSIKGDTTIGVPNGNLANLVVTGQSDLFGETSIGSANAQADLNVNGKATFLDDLEIKGDVTMGSLGDDGVLNYGSNSDDSITTVLGVLDLRQTQLIGYPSLPSTYKLTSKTSILSIGATPNSLYQNSNKVLLSSLWNGESNILLMLTLTKNVRTRLSTGGGSSQTLFLSKEEIKNVSGANDLEKTFIFSYTYSDGDRSTISIGQTGTASSNKVLSNVYESGIFASEIEVRVRIFVENNEKYIQLYGPRLFSPTLVYYFGTNRANYEIRKRKDAWSNVNSMEASLMVIRS